MLRLHRSQTSTGQTPSHYFLTWPHTSVMSARRHLFVYWDQCRETRVLLEHRHFLPPALHSKLSFHRRNPLRAVDHQGTGTRLRGGKTMRKDSLIIQYNAPAPAAVSNIRRAGIPIAGPSPGAMPLRKTGGAIGRLAIWSIHFGTGGEGGPSLFLRH